MNKHKDGFSIRMLHPDESDPSPADALGHPYYVYEKTVPLCASGVLQDAESSQRTYDLVTRSSLLIDTPKMINAFLCATTNLSASNLCAVAKCWRGMIMDEAFDWRMKRGTPTTSGRASLKRTLCGCCCRGSTRAQRGTLPDDVRGPDGHPRG